MRIKIEKYLDFASFLVLYGGQEIARGLTLKASEAWKEALSFAFDYLGSQKEKQ